MNHHGIYRLNILFHLPRLVCVDHHQSIKYSESGIFILCYFFFSFLLMRPYRFVRWHTWDIDEF